MLGMNKTMLFWSLVLALLFLPLFSKADRITSKQTGNWSAPSTWNGGVVPGTNDTAIILDGHTVTNDVKGQGIDVAGLEIRSGGIFDGSNNKVGVANWLIVDGSYSSSNGSKDINFTGGTGTAIGGTGSISLSGTALRVQGNSKFVDTADLTLSANLMLEGGVVLTNNGKITVDGELDGTNAQSEWINGAGSTLVLGLDVIMDNGTFNVDATGNTVTYAYGNSQNIR